MIMKRKSFTWIALIATIGTAILGFLINYITSAILPAWSKDVSGSVALFIAALAVTLTLVAGMKDFLDLLNKSKEYNQVVSKEIRNFSYSEEEKEKIILEYRVAVLEAKLDWILKNEVIKSIPDLELRIIQRKALETIKKNYPEAEIKLEAGWQND
jgi:hypothetical protein